jgi:GNAT superfamily N-acetyltransferase
MNYLLHEDKKITPEEYCRLMESAGWGSGYDLEAVIRSINAYPFVAYARDHSGEVIGYISAFSDGVFSTMLGELVVAPKVQGYGIGRALLNAVEEKYRNVPIYVKPLGDAKKFFLACGYRTPSVEMHVLFKKNERLANSALDITADAPVN